MRNYRESTRENRKITSIREKRFSHQSNALKESTINVMKRVEMGKIIKKIFHKIYEIKQYKSTIITGNEIRNSQELTGRYRQKLEIIS